MSALSAFSAAYPEFPTPDPDTPAWQTAALAAQSRKAEDIVALDIHEISSIADTFVICSGTNPRQVQAIAEAVEESLRTQGLRPIGWEGRGDSNWVLLDYGELVVHVFSEEKRKFYDLERLWKNAPRLSMPEA